MNLTYRGVSYQPASSTLANTHRAGIGTCLGNQFQMQPYDVSQRHSDSPTELTYRGIRYTR